MKHTKTLDLVYIGMAAALIAVCAWISIPLPSGIPVTLQTMGVCLVCAVLGWKRGTLATGVYLLLGLIGVPVFSGFKAGAGVLLGNTGGYLIGFLFTALIVGGVSDLLGKKKLSAAKQMLPLAVAMVLGIAVCYAFGTAWFAIVYARTNEPAGLATILGWCVVPYLVPDLVKIAVASAMAAPLKQAVKRL